MTKCLQCEGDLVVVDDILRASKNSLTEIIDLFAAHNIVVHCRCVGHGAEPYVEIEVRGFLEAERVIATARQHKLNVAETSVNHLPNGKFVLKISFKQGSREMNVGAGSPIPFFE